MATATMFRCPVCSMIVSISFVMLVDLDLVFKVRCGHGDLPVDAPFETWFQIELDLDTAHEVFISGQIPVLIGEELILPEKMRKRVIGFCKDDEDNE